MGYLGEAIMVTAINPHLYLSRWFKGSECNLYGLTGYFVLIVSTDIIVWAVYMDFLCVPYSQQVMHINFD